MLIVVARFANASLQQQLLLPTVPAAVRCARDSLNGLCVTGVCDGFPPQAARSGNLHYHQENALLVSFPACTWLVYVLFNELQSSPCPSAFYRCVAGWSAYSCAPAAVIEAFEWRVPLKSSKKLQ
mgnify:CR=1 FL=1